MNLADTLLFGPKDEETLAQILDTLSDAVATHKIQVVNAKLVVETNQANVFNRDGTNPICRQIGSKITITLETER